jgi:hypothetical protein
MGKQTLTAHYNANAVSTVQYSTVQYSTGHKSALSLRAQNPKHTKTFSCKSVAIAPVTGCLPLFFMFASLGAFFYLWKNAVRLSRMGCGTAFFISVPQGAGRAGLHRGLV